MLLSKGKSSLESTPSRNARSNDLVRNSPTGHRRRPLPVTDGSAPSSSTLLPSTFSPQGKSTRFAVGSNPLSNFFLGGAFYPGKDKKRRQLKRRTLWYRLFCSSRWRRILSLLVTTYLLYSNVIRPFSSRIFDYGSFLASSRRRKGLHGTWLLYDESLLSNIRTVEDERAEAMRLSNEQKSLQSGEDKHQKILERIVPGWYHRNDDHADKNEVVAKKLQEAERIIEQREGASLNELRAHEQPKNQGRAHEQPKDDKHDDKMAEDSRRSRPRENLDTKQRAKPDTTNQEAEDELGTRNDKRRLANASSDNDLNTRTIHNMHLFRNQSECPQALPSKEIRVTLVLQSTPERLWILQRTCQRWTDPIILILFVNSEEAVVDEPLLAEMPNGCPQLKVIRHLADASRGENEREQYPVNRLRNIGLDSVQTSHILMADVDFVPSKDLPELVRATLLARNNWRALPAANTSTSLPPEYREAIVVPAFEVIPQSELCSGPDCRAESMEELMAPSLPSSFDELRSCVSERKECRVFQSHNNIDGHSSTRSKTWLDGKWYEDEVSQEILESQLENENVHRDGDHNTSLARAARIRSLKCFDSVRYEPYVVIRWCPASTEDSPVLGPVAPYYDERFHGYGKNKIELISHLRFMGYTFSILPEGFIIHAPHAISKAKQAWEATKESNLHKSMDELYPKFLKELFAKYRHEKRRIVKQC